MKRFIFAFIALATIACSTEDVAEQPQPSTQVMNFKVADYPSLDATRAGNKKSWEKGDILYVEYIETDIANEYEIITHSLHTLTYNGSSWEINTPITMPNLGKENILNEIEVIYRPGFKPEYSETDQDYSYKPIEISDEIYISGEFLCSMNVVVSENHTITLGNITSDNPAYEKYGGYKSWIVQRSNRIRIAYKPSTTINIVPTNLSYIENSYTIVSLGYNYNITTDSEGNAYIYAYWDFVSGDYIPEGTPSLAIYDGNTYNLLREVTLPTNGEKAPYTTELDTPIWVTIFNAQAYYINLNK